MTHRDITAYLDSKTTHAALGRIGYFATTKRKGTHVDTWAGLHWFVTLTNEDFARMDAGELAKWQEEFRALQTQDQDTGLIFHEGPPSREALTAFQTTVRGHFTELCERAKLRLGPFLMELSMGVLQGRTPPLYSGEHFVHITFPPVPGEMLIYIMGKCLQSCGDLVKRCEWCGEFFLQTRRVRAPQRVQKYCCHLHRTQASKKRAAEKQTARRYAATKRQHDAKRAREASTPQRRVKKGARSHGAPTKK